MKKFDTGQLIFIMIVSVIIFSVFIYRVLHHI